uniref:Uncharacterized protein n=1 Tax=Melanthalia intermedia TaxID=172989 RepID=A0A345UAL7_9FLOR|nr:hypothetical protein [Melanthalia intermedia]AXI97503.1 hypothetical protein [Melanthalia intermedia]
MISMKSLFFDCDQTVFNYLSNFSKKQVSHSCCLIFVLDFRLALNTFKLYMIR